MSVYCDWVGCHVLCLYTVMGWGVMSCVFIMWWGVMSCVCILWWGGVSCPVSVYCDGVGCHVLCLYNVMGRHVLCLYTVMGWIIMTCVFTVIGWGVTSCVCGMAFQCVIYYKQAPSQQTKICLDHWTLDGPSRVNHRRTTRWAISPASSTLTREASCWNRDAI